MKQLKATMKPERKPLTVKLTQKERDLIQRLADEYTMGNVSQWIRYASTKHKPRPTEVAISLELKEGNA